MREAAPIELPSGARVLFTARADGNLSSVAADGPRHGEGRRERLRRRIGVERLARGYQVHGTTVRRIRAAQELEDPSARPADSDGQSTVLRGVGTMVLVADCMPVALACPGAVAMLHAGWRGLAAGVLEEGVMAIEELAPGEPIAAVVGPCAGVCCYEVGDEVHAALGRRAHDGKRLDMRAIARQRLLAAGVSSVEQVGACTICDRDYFSHRREGAAAGRQAGIAWLT